MNKITSFDQLDLVEPLLQSLKDENYSKPTPIQEAAIPLVLDGHDILGCAQTGTGKTAAFAIPIIQNLFVNREANSESARPGDKKGQVKTLVVTPTRELAIQIGESFSKYGSKTKLKHSVIFGGVKQKAQVKDLSRGLDILVATPGRLLDLIGQGFVDLSRVEIFVLDEADRMLDMGFIRDINKIIKLIPAKRQSLFFSATMPKDVAKLADGILSEPKKIEIKPASTTADLVDDKLFFTDRPNKKSLLLKLFKEENMKRVIVFTRTKHGANRLARQLSSSNIEAEAIHGNKSQSTRQRTLKKFSSGEIGVLVATDIVARGIDVEGITHVVNFDLPSEAESYVHRIGRTARAGSSGVAFSFCDKTELDLLLDIEKILNRGIAVLEDHPFHSESALLKFKELKERKSQSRSSRPRGNRSGGGRGQRSGGRRGAAGQGASSGGPGEKSNSGNTRSGKPTKKNSSNNSKAPKSRGNSRSGQQRPPSKGKRSQTKK